MKKKKRSHVFRGTANIFLALLIILQIVALVANNWAGMVNGLLGISDSSIERSADPKDYRFRSDFENPSDLIQAEIDLNTRIAAEGSVVLKGTPRLDGTQVTLFGMRSGENMQFGGSMGELTDSSNIVTLSTALSENGFKVNPDMEEFYKKKAAEYAPSRASGGNVVSSYKGQGSEVGEVPVSEYNADDIGNFKDAAVVVFGRDAGESCCFYPGTNGIANPDEFTDSPTGNILSLSNEERDLLDWVREQGFSKIVVLLNSSGAMEIEELKNDDAVDSIIWIGNPGAYGTYGIAKLLSGEVLPSGHLPDTFAVNSALSPAAQNYGIYTFENAARIDTSSNHALRSEWYLVEAESVYTGYKYYETRYFDSVAGQGNASSAKKGETADGGNKWDYSKEVSYGFGYGIEGSEFTEEISDLNIDWSGETDSVVTVTVKNIGDQAAKHVVQLYVSLPYTDNDRKNGVEKSAIQLVGYAKTGEAQENTYADVVLLEPGASEKVAITFNAQDIYSYDMSYQHDNVSGAYVLEAGDYYFATGNGAHDAVQAVLGELYPDNKEIKDGLQSSGTVHKETLSNDTYLTKSGSEIVQNRLDGADLNKLNAGTTVTYLSRNDWANTFPESISGVTATEDMIYMLSNATYNEEAAKAGYDGPTEFTYGADSSVTVAELTGLDYDDPKYDEVLDAMTLEDLIKQYTANINAIESIVFPRENPSDSPLGLIATIGQRTDGTIYELSESDPAYGHHTSVYVSGPITAATFSPFLQEEEGRIVGNDALWTGYSTWFGPGMNLHRTPYNGRNLSYYSEDAVLTGMTAVYVHRGLDRKGIVSNAKHFAFNDQETNREGVAVFLSEQAARENELRAFQIPVRDGSLKGLMSAFNRIGCTHVGASTGLMNGILRGEWEFNGYLITDSVKSAQYFLPKECLLAGNDMMLGGSNNGDTWGFTTETVEKDPVLQAALRESFHRKLYFYTNSALMNGITPESGVGNAKPWWVVTLQVLGGICLLGFIVFLILLIRKISTESNAAKRNESEITAGIVTLVLGIAALILFCLSYHTGYYIFGQMQSGVIAVLLSAGLIAGMAALAARWKFPDAFWSKFLTFAVTGLLASAAMLLVGDRVEGIGNCVITDYDSGHGGEEAVYLSMAASILMLIAVAYNIIGSFAGDKTTAEMLSKEKRRSIRIRFGVSAAVMLIAVLVPTVNLVYGNSGGRGQETGISSGQEAGGVYTVSYNQASGNAETIPEYQFLCSDFGGILAADSRIFVDVSLTLEENEKYRLFSEAYVIEGDKRAEIGDDTGLGMVMTMNAEGTYEDNGDGTVKTSVPDHAVFEVQTDVYSSQMKEAIALNIDGSTEDGVYDSTETPAVIGSVPETIWTLEDGTIQTWRDAGKAGGTYTVSFNQNNGNLETMPDYQFLGGDFRGLLGADSRMFLDVALTLDGNDSYSLFAEVYVAEGDERAQIGDDTGLGMVLNMNANGSYVENEDGTYTTSVPDHVIFEMQTDVYSGQMKEAAGLGVDGSTKDGVYDSNEVQAVLDFVPETVWTMGDSQMIDHWVESGTDSDKSGSNIPDSDEQAEGLIISSDDGATTFAFYADGTYLFEFEPYEIEDAGTYRYDGKVLTIIDANGTETTAEGDPLKFHYVASVSDQLSGDFTIAAAEFQK